LTNQKLAGKNSNRAKPIPELGIDWKAKALSGLPTFNITFMGNSGIVSTSRVTRSKGINPP
jgi:hypothetical protein